MTTNPLPTRSPTDPVGLTRRKFLTLTGAAVGGAAILGPSKLVAARTGSAFEVLSVGYVEGSDALATFRPLPWPLSRWAGDPENPGAGPTPLDVIPAASLLMGDPELSQESLWMRVHGLYPGLDEGVELDFDSANLIVYYPPDDPQVGEIAPVIVWGGRGGSRPTAGSPVRVPVPLRVDGGLDLVFEIRALERSRGSQSSGMQFATGLSSQGRPPVQYATSFTVDPIDGLPKIQRGIYLLGLAPDTWDRPSRLRRGPKGRADFRDLSLVVSFEPMSPEP